MKNTQKEGFDLQLFAVNLPENPSVNLALAGRAFLVYINTGTVEIPEWFKIGGQRGATRNMEGTEIDTSNKSDDGWGSHIVGMLNWSIDLELIATGDASGNVSQTMEILNTALRCRKQLHIKFEYPDGSYETGWANVINQPLAAAHDDVATISMSLKGVGPLSELMTPEEP